MVRHYGRSPCGKHGHWKTLTLVAALRVDRMTAPYTIDGAMDGPSFLAYEHRGFKEEQEVRLVVSPMNQNYMNVEDPDLTAKHAGKVLKPRNNRPNLASYVALFGDKPLPISKIIVGPHANKEMRRVRVQRYIELLGLEIEVVCSQTPLIA
jgi:hypothetical protein